MAKEVEILLAEPRGFCAGVERAIEILERAIQIYGIPIYVKHEIVHNAHVVNYFKNQGVIFIELPEEVPENSVLILSPHGVSKIMEQQTRAKCKLVIDATCPLVKKVHKEIERYEQKKRQIIIIGTAKHPEIEGTAGQINSEIILVQSLQDVYNLKIPRDMPLAYVTQTTLSLDDTKEIIAALNQRFIDIIGPNTKDVCYASQNRQDAVKNLVDLVDLVLVIGGLNSSNSNKLRDTAARIQEKSYLIRDYQDIKSVWLKDVNKIGISAGASTPEYLVEQVIAHLKELFKIKIRKIEYIKENVYFKLPAEVEYDSS
jgi:4-hydroxy-3-methylbut-2-enyl diphosphate reductase